MDRYITFLRKNIVYKVSDFFSKNLNFKKITFPKSSILHLLDNFNNKSDKIIDSLDLNSYPFLYNRDIKKIYYNNININKNLLKNIETKLRLNFIKTNLNTNLRVFNNNLNNIPSLKVIKSLSQFDNSFSSDFTLGIVNHNPLFRLNIFGIPERYKETYKRYLILNNILDFILNNLSEKQQFIFISLDNTNVIQKTIFNTILKLDSIPDSYINYMDDLTYLLVNILSYINNDKKSSLSIFNKYKSKILNNLNFVFYNTDTLDCIIYNLEKLKSICKESKEIKWKFLTSVYMISKNTSPKKINKQLLVDKPILNIVPETNIKKKILIEETDPIEIANDNKIIEISKKYNTFLKDLSTEVNDNISKNPNLTPSQKQRYKTLTEKSLNIVANIDGKDININQLINKKISLSIDNVRDLTDKIDDTVMDKSYAKSNIIDFNQAYFDKLFYQDMFKSLLAFQKNGLILTGYSEENIRSDINMIKKIKISFTNIDGKKRTLKYEIPIPDEDGYFRYNGVKSFMKKQLVNLPIVKINDYRVSISSNYGKTIVERNQSIRYNFGKTILKTLEKYNKDNPKDPIEFTKQYVKFNNIKVPYDYSSIGQNIKNIKFNNMNFIFNYHDRLSFNKKFKKEQLIKLEEKYKAVFIGYTIKENDPILMDKNNIVKTIDFSSEKVLSESFIIDKILPPNYIDTKPEWVKLFILNKKLPVIFVLAYKYGLLNTLDYIKVKYRLVDKGNRLNLLSNEIPIKFKDKTLIVSRYPLTKSWIVAGLLDFNILDTISFTDMDNPDIYFTLMESKGLALNYLKGIDNLYNFFIDPITAEILKELNEPINIKDLLIRATEILNIDYHEQAASLKNYKIRSLDRINGILYNEIARQYAQYLNDKSKNTSFTINTKAVIMKTLQDQSVVLAEEINPIQYIKERTALTHAGFLGRDSESFVEKDIAYPDDGLGLLSEATPDSAKVGFNSYSPLNTSVKNIRGMIDVKDVKDLEGGQILSVTGELMPFASYDDPKRINFINIQLSHHVPSQYATPTRVRTGLESLIGDFSNSLYAVIAKDNGKVISVDDTNKTFTIKYNKDENLYLYNYGEVLGEVSSLSIVHNIKLNIKNKTFKKGDVLAYNTGFFSLDEIHNQLNWNHGVTANIALTEANTTLEDANGFTEDFINKFDFKVNHKRPIKISTDLTIKNILKIGDEVDYNTPLVTLEYSDVYDAARFRRIKKDDPTDNDIFEELNQIVTYSKHKGVIKDIKFYYTGELFNYHPTVQKELKKYINKINKLKKLSNSIINKEKVNIQIKIDPGTRIKKEVVEKDELLILFFITSDISSSTGDKFVIDGALKTVNGSIIDYPLESKSGIKIDGLFGGKSVFNRIVLSPFKMGLLDRILEKIENNAITKYFNKE